MLLESALLSTPPKHTASMAPLKSEPPGMERDSKGHAIPMKQRVPEDQAKAKRARAKQGGSTGHLPMRSDAVSGAAARTPATPPNKRKSK